MEFRPTKDQITLHGLGFLQVILPGNQRIHVWHPGLPKRACFESSSIHDHRFGFVSRVLIGRQINQLYRETSFAPADDPTHISYLHEGKRTKFGNRPWLTHKCCALEPVGQPRIIEVGQQYEMNPYMLHSTNCEGVTVTLMTKTHEEDKGSKSYCKYGIEPDVDFDRKQWSQEHLWEIFTEAMRTT